MSVAEVQIQGVVMQLILLGATEIIIKKETGIMTMIKRELVEIAIEIDIGLMTEIATIVTAAITKIGAETVMIMIGKIALVTLMVVKIMEDLESETLTGIVTAIVTVIVIVIEAMIEIATGIMITETEQDTAAETGRGTMDITVMKLYTCSLSCEMIYILLLIKYDGNL